MRTTISIGAIHPHPILTTVFGDVIPDPLRLSLRTAQPTATVVTPDHRLLRGYWAFLAAREAGEPTVTIEYSPLTDEDEMQGYALLAMLANEESRAYCSRITLLTIARVLYEIEARRAKERQRANARRSVGKRRAPHAPKAPRDAAGPARKLVADALAPYCQGLGEKSLEHGIRVLNTIEALRHAGRDQDADRLRKVLEHTSIDQAYRLQRSEYADQVSPDTDVQLNTGCQHRYAAYQWVPITKAPQDGILLHQERLHVPLALPATPVDAASARFVVVSPEFDFGTKSLTREMLGTLLAVIRQTPEREFVLCARHPQNLVNKLVPPGASPPQDLPHTWPANAWLGKIVESTEELGYARAFIPPTGMRFLVVLRPGEAQPWDFGSGQGRGQRFCDWLVIEFAYDALQRRRCLNGETVFRAMAYADRAAIPCHVEIDLRMFAYPWPRRYPSDETPSSTPGGPAPTNPVRDPPQRPPRPWPDHDEVI